MSSLSRETYIKRFRLAEKLLRELGYTNICNPIRVWTCRFPWLYKIVGYKLTLLYDLWLLMRCDYIFQLLGMYRSKGAMIEDVVAYHFGVDCMDCEMQDRINEQIVQQHPTKYENTEED